MRFFLCFLLFAAGCFAEDSVILQLKGHLGQEELAAAIKALAANPKEVGVLVNSSSGDLEKSLELAKRLYALKVQNKTDVSVHIEDNALGPAAIFPFLANRLSISYSLSWGDVNYGAEQKLPVNLLRNRVTGLIIEDPSGILHKLAVGMTDPEAQIPSIKKDGDEAIVVNQNQILEWGLADRESAQAFLERYISAAKPVEIKAETLEEKLAKHIKYSSTGVNKIGRIYIGDQATMISQSTWIYVKNALDYYKKNKPAFIILELNTPGGEVYAAQKISDALKEMDTQYGVPCVAFINNWALSAGAMLSYSCRFISIVKDGSIGAAEPVTIGEGGKMESAPEKINSALRTDFANRAKFFERNSDIAQAMVDKDILLVLRSGKIVRLQEKDQIRQGDQLISAQGKLLTLDSQDAVKYGVAQFQLLPEQLPAITDKEETKGSWPASKTLLFQQPFFKQIPNAVIDTWQMDWKTEFLALLARPMVASLLFLAMMLGFYVEINTPGFGLPGSVALIALFLMVLSSVALEVAELLEAVLLLAGIIFIALDVFLIPTFGILGLTGILMAIAGLFALMLPGIGSLDFDFSTNTFNPAGDVFLQRLGWFAATFVLGLIFIAILARYVMPTFSPFQRFVLSGGEQEGYAARGDEIEFPKIGARGKVLATLRPAGKVSIDGDIWDAVTHGGFIERGEEIEVVQLGPSAVIVDIVRKT